MLKRSMAILVALVLAGAMLYIVAERLLTVEKIIVTGGDDALQTQIKELIHPAFGKSFLNIDMHAQKRLAEAVPGVLRAEVQRVLPDTLKIRLHAPKALARWADGGLIDLVGNRYGGAAANLPIFSGDEKWLPAMAEFYSKATVEEAEAFIAQVEVSSSGDWRIFLRDGPVLYLGRDNLLPRFHRYAAYAGYLRKQFSALQVVDLRYESGFAIVNRDETED